VKTLEEIEKYTSVLVCPNLLINEKLFSTDGSLKKKRLSNGSSNLLMELRMSQEFSAEDYGTFQNDSKDVCYRR